MLRGVAIAAASVMLTMNLNAAVKVEKVEYKGWHNCWRVTNGDVELIITGDVGPRIIRYAFVNDQNLFKEFPDQLGKSGEKDFQLRGGDRVWKAPEDHVATWAPDNVPVDITPTSTGLIARAPLELLTNLQKEIEISLAPSGTQVRVAHRIRNRSLFDLEFSPWVLTMMAPGGIAVTAFPPRGKHPIDLAVTNPLAMWAYTDLSDKRLSFTKKYLALRQDPKNSAAQKIGLFNAKTWAAYVLNGQAFIKVSQADPGKAYPDFGCSFETFTNDEFLEMETLGPLTKVPAGGQVEQVERWGLYKNVELHEINDEEIDRVLLPMVQTTEGPKL